MMGKLEKKSNDQEDVEQNRVTIIEDKWSNKTQFFFALLGYTISIGKIWRFPYLCYKNGGGAFLIPYYLGSIFCAMPVFLLEVLLGQFTSSSNPNMWNITPLFKGFGYSMLIVNFLTYLYYIIVMVWAFFFLFMSFNPVLPWSTCNNSWNTDKCVTIDELNKRLNNTMNYTIEMKSSAEEFWDNRVIRATSSLDQFGEINLELLGCLALSWLAIYFCLFKGVGWTGKVSVFTSIFPYTIMFIMLVRAVTLESAWIGIKYLFTPDWSKLYDINIWFDGISQALWNYGLCINCMTTLGSYNNFNHNSYKESLIVSLFNELTNILSGIIVFAVLGFMTTQTGQSIEDVVTGGPGLVYIVYPNALAQMPYSQFWSILFFVMLIFVTIDGQFVGVEGFVAGVFGRWPALKSKRKLFLFIYCCINYLIGTIFVTQGGIYWFELFNTFAYGGYVLFLFSFIQCILVSYVYGLNKFYENIKTMVGFYPGVCWKYIWSVITPIILFILFIFSLTKFERLRLNDYVYPLYGELIGWSMILIEVSVIPLYAVYKLIQKKYKNNAH